MKRDLSGDQCQGFFQQRAEPFAGKQRWQQRLHDGMGIGPIDALVDRQLGKIMGRLNRKGFQVIGQYFGSDILHDSVLRQTRDMLQIKAMIKPLDSKRSANGVIASQPAKQHTASSIIVPEYDHVEASICIISKQPAA